MYIQGQVAASLKSLAPVLLEPHIQPKHATNHQVAHLDASKQFWETIKCWQQLKYYGMIPMHWQPHIEKTTDSFSSLLYHSLLRVLLREMLSPFLEQLLKTSDNSLRQSQLLGIWLCVLPFPNTYKIIPCCYNSGRWKYTYKVFSAFGISWVGRTLLLKARTHTEPQSNCHVIVTAEPLKHAVCSKQDHIQKALLVSTPSEWCEGPYVQVVNTSKLHRSATSQYQH